MTIWCDDAGERRPLPSSRSSLKFCLPSHAALRAFVFKRDHYMCKWCGAQAREIPAKYDGRFTLAADGQRFGLVVDHVLSRRHGGTHHPDNLQTLCDSCNAIKGNTVDRGAHSIHQA